MSTLETLTSKLRTELKIDPNGRVWNDNTLYRALNDAQEQIQQDGNHDWHFNDAENSENTVIDQAAYTLPTDFVRIEKDSILYNDSPLKVHEYNDLWQRGWLSTSGTPTLYGLRGTSIYLALRPNAVNTLKYLYRKKLTSMSATTDDSGMPSEFDLAMVKWAAYLLWSTIEGRENKGISAAQDYQEAIKGLFAQYLGRRDESAFSFNFELS